MGKLAVRLFGFALKSGIPIWVYAVGIGVVLSGLYGGYRYWKHQIYLTGVEDTVKAVEKQNSVAAAAAHKVLLTQEDCYEKGGWWDNTKDGCADE